MEYVCCCSGKRRSRTSATIASTAVWIALARSAYCLTKRGALAASVRDRTAGYLQAAIFELAGVDEATRTALSEPPYHEPYRSLISRYMCGRGLGTVEELADPTEEYPLARWSSRLKTWVKDAHGDTYTAQPEETLTYVIGPNARYQRERIKMWSARGVQVSPGSTVEHTVKRAGERSDEPSRGGAQPGR
jgi:hypothetical protein